MEQIAFRMQLLAGQQQEYQRRHDAIWPELITLLHQCGVRDYSIFLDETTGVLFAVLRRLPDHTMDDLPLHRVMQRWWAYMQDIMEAHADHSPVSTPLIPMFHLD